MIPRRRQQVVKIAVVVLLVYLLHVAYRRSKTEFEVIEHWDDRLHDGDFLDDVLDNTELREPLDATWQPVRGSKSKFLVYSAFYERREGSRVRVICAATTRQAPAEPAWCVYRFNGTATVRVTKGNLKVIREHHNLKYSACFVLCPLSADGEVPTSVSVVSAVDAATPPSNHLAVIDNTRLVGPPGKMAVCVKPVHNYGQTLQLIEFISLYSLLGVDHFTFYRHNVTKEIDCLIGRCLEDERCDWLSWELDLKSALEIRTEGIFAALNDCLYRNMYRYELIAMVDLDEYIIPRRNETLIELIERLDRAHPGSFGSYLFLNAFFYQTWPSPGGSSSNGELSSRLLTLSKTRRKSRLLPHRQRSKYIVKPELIVEAGNHFVWQHLSKIKEMKVAADDALSQHYRAVCEFGGEACLKEPSQVDDNALRLADALLDRVKVIMDILQAECPRG